MRFDSAQASFKSQVPSHQAQGLKILFSLSTVESHHGDVTLCANFDFATCSIYNRILQILVNLFLLISLIIHRAFFSFLPIKITSQLFQFLPCWLVEDSKNTTKNRTTSSFAREGITAAWKKSASQSTCYFLSPHLICEGSPFCLTIFLNVLVLMEDTCIYLASSV